MRDVAGHQRRHHLTKDVVPASGRHRSCQHADSRLPPCACLCCAFPCSASVFLVGRWVQRVHYTHVNLSMAELKASCWGKMLMLKP